MNGLIGGLNKLQVPDWVPLIGGKGINIPSIPMLYKGTDYFQPTRAWGNMAIVGEEGPELVELPTGSRVNTAKETRRLLQNSSEEEASPISIQRIEEKLDEILNALKKISELKIYLDKYTLVGELAPGVSQELARGVRFR